MSSDFLTPFLELEGEFYMTRDPDEASCVASQLQLRAVGFQRRHSHCPITLPNSKFNSPEAEGPWGLTLEPQQQWSRELPRSALSHIPFRVDRSVSMIETPHISTRYKTELCRTYEESGACKYGAKCQFAHGSEELRILSRHPKYKTEPCRTFHTIGFCPYGARCHFIHNADELCSAVPRKPRAPQLRHSISFSGFSSVQQFEPVDEAQAPRLFGRASSMSSSPLSSGSPDCSSPQFQEPRALRHFSYPFSALLDLGDDSALQFSAVTDHVPLLSGALWRCSSADCVSEEDYASSGSTSSESPCEGQRLSIFNHMPLTVKETEPGLNQV